MPVGKRGKIKGSMSSVGVEQKERNNHKESWAAAQLSLWLALNGSAVEYSVAKTREVTNTEA